MNNHINGSEIVEVCDGKLMVGSLETGLLTLVLDENSGNYSFPFEYIGKLNKFWGNEDPKLGLSLRYCLGQGSTCDILVPHS